MNQPTEPGPAGEVHCSYENGVKILRLDHEARLNALSSHMLRSLAAEIKRTPIESGVRGIVVTGTGRAFSSGEDLRETRSFVDAHGMDALSALFDDITEAVLTSTVPCVAAVNGMAIGGAAELTLCFDRRVGSTDTSYRFPESAMGFTISNASSILLPRLVGAATALDIILSGTTLDASTCQRIGLLDEVVEPDSLIKSCLAAIERWTPQGNTAHLHLPMLRPDLPTVHSAFAREADAARQAWTAGSMNAQISRFNS
ncbi:enoyl-CoA hydratase/isomerase family protein [Sphaerisporangium sp. NPDC051017]|uniref:enoyl-CoA hydratase/isomerase family protein n=1 Tax=Sphaerisporangium sp. NPDC051017 TaxID=3154636 RepID=UPI00344999EA